MPDFHRPPDWEQPADRHTPLIDPVLTVRQLSRFEFARKSLTRIDHALVFSTPRGGYDAYLPPLRPTRTEAASKRYSAVYEVDMGVHPLTAELSLPSSNDAFEFGAVVNLSWQVRDPARFVASGHRDVPALLLGELEQAARQVARHFPVAQSAAAERELLEVVTARGPLGGPAGLQVTWTVRLRRDQENIDHQRRLQAIEHGSAEQVLTHRRAMDVDAEMDLRNRQQDALVAARTLAYGEQDHELALRRQQRQHEQALLAGRHQVDLQRIEAEKVDFYQGHLAQGGVHAWALHLAQHPEDTSLVMNTMRDDQLRLIQAQMDLIGRLLGGDVAQDYELEGPKQLALRAMSDVLNQRLPGVPQQGPNLPPVAGAPGRPGPGAAHDAPLAPAAPPQEAPPAAPPAGTPSQPARHTGPSHAGTTPAHPSGGTPGPAATEQVRPPEPGSPLPAQHSYPRTVVPAAPPPPTYAPSPGAFPGWQPPPGYGSSPVGPFADPPVVAPAADGVRAEARTADSPPPPDEDPGLPADRPRPSTP